MKEKKRVMSIQCKSKMTQAIKMTHKPPINASPALQPIHKCLKKEL
jgi:hypothetical protein